MALPQPQPDRKFNYDDYLHWPDEERWELIDGVAYDMSPAPTRKHQEIISNLAVDFGNFLKSKQCKMYLAPFDVRLKENEASDEETCTVVQPDIVVFCDKSKLDKRGAVGAPDLCIEILSDSTGYKDETVKLKLYEKHGVREYWLVNPDTETLFVYLHNGLKFDKPVVYNNDEAVEVAVLEGLRIILSEVFEFEE